ncbi:MAG: hypothetical protein DI539_01245 [Flavobacterium psychrophilum]|nr:MAG: hypothetical protein DI539_01245 [Flavobacterium psychrophilum]
MNRLSLLLLFISLSAFAQIKIPFTLTDGGHTLVKAKINGVEGMFIFDTGAGLNMITKKFADKVGTLQKTDEFYVGHRATGEAIDTDLYLTKTIEMGDFKIDGQMTSVIDIEFPIDGLISLMPFKDKAITIDYTNKVLVIETKKSVDQLTKTGKTIPIQIDDEKGKTLGINTYITLGNKLNLQVVLDSGAGFNVFRFSSRYMDELGIDPAKTEKTSRKSEFTGSENNYYSTMVSSMTTKDASIKKENFKATFIDGLIYQGIMCINWLGNKITIDIPNSKIIANQ